MPVVGPGGGELVGPLGVCLVVGYSFFGDICAWGTFVADLEAVGGFLGGCGYVCEGVLGI